MTTPACLNFMIFQGATFRTVLERMTVPYEVRWECGQLVSACSGEPVPDADMTPEDYTGCKVRMQMRRSVEDTEVLLELTTENGGFEAVGRSLRLLITSAQSAAFVYGYAPPGWTSCIGHVEVERPSGDIERQYELSFGLAPEGTR